MSFPSAFGSQVAAIFDVLAKAAVAEIATLAEEGSLALRLEVSRRDAEIRQLQSDLRRLEAELREASAQQAAAEKQTPRAAAAEPQPRRDSNQHHEVLDRAYPELRPADSLCEARLSPAVKQEPEVELPFGESDAPDRGAFQKSGVALQQPPLLFPSGVEERSPPRNVRGSFSSSGQEGADACFSAPLKEQISAHQECVHQDVLHPGVVRDAHTESAGPSAASLRVRASTAGASGSSEENNSRINRRPKRPTTVWRANHSVYICSVCNKGFLRLSQLEEHKTSHQTAKPFRCLECGKTFTQRTRLKTHQRVHTGERPFDCSICGKRFSRQDNCLRHERFHSGLKPFSCRQCGKSFTVLGNLKIHQVIHLRGR